jgi:hypothetical protein
MRHLVHVDPAGAVAGGTRCRAAESAGGARVVHRGWDGEAASRLAGGLVPLWWVRSRLGEATVWLDRTLTASADELGRVCAFAPKWAGSFQATAGYYTRAETL